VELVSLLFRDSTRKNIGFQAHLLFFAFLSDGNPIDLPIVFDILLDGWWIIINPNPGMLTARCCPCPHMHEPPPPKARGVRTKSSSNPRHAYRQLPWHRQLVLFSIPRLRFQLLGSPSRMDWHGVHGYTTS
jgi:hypothetical protein